MSEVYSCQLLLKFIVAVAYTLLTVAVVVLIAVVPVIAAALGTDASMCANLVNF